MKIVVVEDSVVIRKHVIALLESVSGVSVVGEAGSEQAALKLIPTLQVDVVILDIHLTPGNGFNVLKALRASGNTAEIFVFTNQTLEHYRQLSKTLGATGFYDKTRDIETMLNRIEAMSAGQAN